jgi:hypothetical protein
MKNEFCTYFCVQHEHLVYYMRHHSHLGEFKPKIQLCCKCCHLAGYCGYLLKLIHYNIHNNNKVLKVSAGILHNESRKAPLDYNNNKQ